MQATSSMRLHVCAAWCGRLHLAEGLRVRKELRKLSDTEYRAFIAALSTMTAVPTDAGRKLFGPKYISYMEIMLKHAVSVNDPRGDQVGRAANRLRALANFAPWPPWCTACLSLPLSNRSVDMWTHGCILSAQTHSGSPPLTPVSLAGTLRPMLHDLPPRPAAGAGGVAAVSLSRTQSPALLGHHQRQPRRRLFVRTQWIGGEGGVAKGCHTTVVLASIMCQGPVGHLWNQLRLELCCNCGINYG